ncbi:unnamed protein product [marine sediment metagenome]|uniref:Uncharacterized protein n=1 Tax=marine sediment metagenome TaxID=412755 RepID=X1IXU4_9ZZZZ
MPISPDAKRITDKVYTIYGSDSGHLFGLLPIERQSVEMIIQATIEIFMNEQQKVR